MNILDIIKNNKKEIIISNIIIFYMTMCYNLPLFLNLYFNIEPCRINLDFIDSKIPFIKFFVIFYVYYYIHICILIILIGLLYKESFYNYILL